jgi:hypothetical protein
MVGTWSFQVVGNSPINATVSATPVAPPSTPPGLTGSGGRRVDPRQVLRERPDFREVGRGP